MGHHSPVPVPQPSWVLSLSGANTSGLFVPKPSRSADHARKTTRRYPRRFAEEFAASGLEVADLAAFAAAWRARVTAPAL